MVEKRQRTSSPEQVTTSDQGTSTSRLSTFHAVQQMEDSSIGLQSSHLEVWEEEPVVMESVGRYSDGEESIVPNLPPFSCLAESADTEVATERVSQSSATVVAEGVRTGSSAIPELQREQESASSSTAAEPNAAAGDQPQPLGDQPQPSGQSLESEESEGEENQLPDVEESSEALPVEPEASEDSNERQPSTSDLASVRVRRPIVWQANDDGTGRSDVVQSSSPIRGRIGRLQLGRRSRPPISSLRRRGIFRALHRHL
ncbi:unnamed protein product [Soboliphyme baturini]|uniref:Uncharacterized protein n=1 Tax=Soboliphyme baturini TaxID=241478 RepID=A0A183J8X2_9BILA|nr:unnamed protein product [Soboliphyme baturini]